MTEADLIHFVTAQARVNRQVVEELTDGRKRTHWMWFVFPQLSGLGHSPMAQRYAIRNIDQASFDPIMASRILGRWTCSGPSNSLGFVNFLASRQSAIK